MQNTGCPRICEMDARVDVERRLLDFSLTGEDPAFGVQRDQVGRGDLAPVKPVAVEQEGSAIGQHDAEVVADAFVQIQSHCEAESRGEVDAHGALDRSVDLLFLDSHAAIIKRKGAARAPFQSVKRCSYL